MSERNDPNENPETPLCTGDPLAKALAGLEPMPSSLNRDVLMFAAGGTSRDRDVAFWRRIVFAQAGAFCMLFAVGLSTDVFQGSSRSGSWGGGMARVPSPVPTPTPMTKPMAKPKVEESPKPELYVAQPLPSDEPDFAAQLKYLRLRADVLAAGINVLPTTPTNTNPVDIGQLEDTLQMPRGTFASYGVVPKQKKTNEEK